MPGGQPLRRRPEDRDHLARRESYISQHATGDWVFDYGTTGNDQMYWEANRNKLTYVGTSDEIVPFNSLPLGLLSEDLAGALFVGTM